MVTISACTVEGKDDGLCEATVRLMRNHPCCWGELSLTANSISLFLITIPNWSSRQFDREILPLPHQDRIELRGGGGGSRTVFRGGRVPPRQSTNNESSKPSSSSTAITEGWKNSLASGLASVCAKTLLQPFDTIKTVQQHSEGETTLSLLQAMQVVLTRPDGAGWKDLYAGLTVSALGSIPSISLYYGIYSYCKRTLFSWMLEAKIQNKQINSSSTTTTSFKADDQTLKLLAVGMAAAIGKYEMSFFHNVFSRVFYSQISVCVICCSTAGNTIASFSRVPYEVVKQKLQTGQYAHTVDAIVSLFREKGFLGAFFPPGGVAIQMLRDVPYAIVTLLVYEYLRDVWNANQQDGRQIVWKDMAIGALAGGTGSFVTNGLDVLKTRLQTSPPEVYGGSILKCARMTYQEGGIRVFLRGSTSRLMHKMPANAFFFYFYELFRTLLKVDRSKQQ